MYNVVSRNAQHFKNDVRLSTSAISIGNENAIGGDYMIKMK